MNLFGTKLARVRDLGRDRRPRRRALRDAAHHRSRPATSTSSTASRCSRSPSSAASARSVVRCSRGISLYVVLPLIATLWPGVGPLGRPAARRVPASGSAGTRTARSTTCARASPRSPSSPSSLLVMTLAVARVLRPAARRRDRQLDVRRAAWSSSRWSRRSSRRCSAAAEQRTRARLDGDRRGDAARVGRHRPARGTTTTWTRSTGTSGRARANGSPVALLEVDAATVRFGGNVALDAVSLEAEPGVGHRAHRPERRGQDHAVQRDHRAAAAEPGPGPRSAGKDVTRLSPTRRARLGLGRTFQRLELFSLLSVRENIRVAADVRKGWSHDKDNPAEVVEAIIERVGLTARRRRAGRLAAHRSVPPRRARPLPRDQAEGAAPRRARVGSGRERDRASSRRCCARSPPTASRSCSSSTTSQLVMDVCTTVHVLDFGRIIATGTPAEIQTDEAVLAAYLGTQRREPARAARRSAPPTTASTCCSASTSRSPRAASSRCSGPNGAGQDHHAAGRGRAAPADRRRRDGRRPPGQRRPRPRTSPAAGLCLIPEGRGIFPNLTVRENLRMMTYSGAGLSAIEERGLRPLPPAGGAAQADRGHAVRRRAADARDGAGAGDRIRRCSCSTSCRWGSRRSSSRSCTRSWPRSRATACRSSWSSSSRAPCSGVADLAAVLVHGKVARVGTPHELQDELSKAYLGGEPR